MVLAIATGHFALVCFTFECSRELLACWFAVRLGLKLREKWFIWLRDARPIVALTLEKRIFASNCASSSVTVRKLAQFCSYSPSQKTLQNYKTVNFASHGIELTFLLERTNAITQPQPLA